MDETKRKDAIREITKYQMQLLKDSSRNKNLVEITWENIKIKLIKKKSLTAYEEKKILYTLGVNLS